MESRFAAKAFAFLLFPLIALPFVRFGATGNSATSRAGAIAEVRPGQAQQAPSRTLGKTPALGNGPSATGLPGR